MEEYVMSRERKLFPRSWSLFHLANSMRKAVTKRASVFEVESRLAGCVELDNRLRNCEYRMEFISTVSPSPFLSQYKLRSLSLSLFPSRGYAISSRVPSIIFPRITFNRLERYVLLLVQPYPATIQ